MASNRKPASGASGTTGAKRAGGSTALPAIQVQALTTNAESSLARLVGSETAVAKMPGPGGEVVRQGGVVRVTGRDYRTSAGTVPASEIFFATGTPPVTPDRRSARPTRSRGSIRRPVTSAS